MGNLENRKSVTPGEMVAVRMKELRKKRGWSQEQLANELDRHEVPINRTTIAKMEAHPQSTRAENISLVNVLALGIVLGVNPVELFSPQNPDVWLRVGETLIPPRQLRQWLRQQQPLREQDSKWYDTEIPEEEWQDQVARIRQDIGVPLFDGRGTIFAPEVTQEAEDSDE